MLDTNIVIDVLKRRPIKVLATFNAKASRMAISSMTLAVLPYSAKAAQHYAVIRAALEELGQPIDARDLHMAGHARSEGLVLVKNSTSEFAHVPALEVENWVHLGQ